MYCTNYTNYTNYRFVKESYMYDDSTRTDFVANTLFALAISDFARRMYDFT